MTLCTDNNADDLDIQNQIDGLVTVTGAQQIQLNVLLASVIAHGNRMDSLQTELRELTDRVNETDALLKRYTNTYTTPVNVCDRYLNVCACVCIVVLCLLHASNC